MNIDYPETIQEFVDVFKTDKECYEYLVKIRWPKGFVCPKCNSVKHTKHTRDLTYRCRTCLKETTVTSGTIFHNRHLPIKTWFYAVWFMVSQKSGISALGLSRELGIKRQMTGWSLLKIIRRSMWQIGREKLKGIVEIDEVFIGGIYKGIRGRGALGKVMVLVAVEDKGGKKIGRIRMCVIENATSATLLKAIQSMVEVGSTIHTDEFRSYEMLSNHNYTHEAIKKEESKDNTPLVHRVASLLKRWLLGTHQGGVHLNNLQSYLDEYVFRFNRRTSASRGKLFYRLIQEMTKTTRKVTSGETTA